MTDRKPAGVTWESWIDRQIRAARERGEFDDLPGHGRPLEDLDRARDDLWWVRKWLQREELSFTPPTLAVRRAREALLDRLPTFATEEAVRRAVSDLNAEIRKVNRTAVSGPPSTTMVLDVDEVVARWEASRT